MEQQTTPACELVISTSTLLTLQEPIIVSNSMSSRRKAFAAELIEAEHLRVKLKCKQTLSCKADEAECVFGVAIKAVDAVVTYWKW